MKKLFILLLGIFLLAGCSDKKNDNLIDTTYAKELLINTGAILIDVRTQDEYDANHINGANLVPLDEINEESISKYVATKETPIIVYCQSGNRSSQAVTKLKDLGYTEVYDLGSIDNWEE